MSLIAVYDRELTNSKFNIGKAIPKDCFDMKREIMVARHLDGCSDLMQRHYPTEELLILGCKRKRSRRSNKPFFPIKEEVHTCQTKLPNYVGFSCRHYIMHACLRYNISPYLMRIFV